MKTLRLSFKLIGVLLASIGIGGCGDDDEGGSGSQDCITCTYDYGTYQDTYEFCRSDQYIVDLLADQGVTWDQFVTGLKFAANQTPELDCD